MFNQCWLSVCRTSISRLCLLGSYGCFSYPVERIRIPLHWRESPYKVKDASLVSNANRSVPAPISADSLDKQPSEIGALLKTRGGICEPTNTDRWPSSGTIPANVSDVDQTLSRYWVGVSIRADDMLTRRRVKDTCCRLLHKSHDQKRRQINRRHLFTFGFFDL